MLQSIVYTTRFTPLSKQEVLALLENPKDEMISTLPAINPNHGDVYLYSYKGRPEAKKDWRADQLRWVHKGVHSLPKKNPTIVKTYHQRIICGMREKFYRYGYESTDERVRMVVVHYLSGCTRGIVDRYPQCSDDGTLPSLLENIDSSRNGFKIETVDASNFHVQLPESVGQISHKMKNVRTKRKMSREDLYGVYDLHFALDNFIRNLILMPEFIIVVSLPEIVNLYNEVCSINQHQLLSYDTTFRLGEYFVSPIVFKCPFFEEQPSIPLAAMISDNRSIDVHKIFFRAMNDITVNFDCSDVRLVTDREWTMTSALDSVIRNIKHVFRWDHILKDVGSWLTTHKHRAAKLDYLTHIRQLLDSDSEEDFQRLYEGYLKEWSQPFVLYFEENIKYDILHKSGKWLLNELGIYTSDIGVTSNVSESMNALLKRLTAWKDVNLEQMVLALYFLQTFYLKEVLRGRCGTGNYRLREEYVHLAMDSASVVFNDDYFYLTPDDIIAFLENKSWNLTQNVDS
ncbi:uncharacterized protein LOC142151269 [Mixophyes fleayi]|uniref:uncharacterized protein LOC142151269 n=1 Tax=Mixophyes fleayi TaxID=3061075 RepID=UPI003F4E2A69